MPENIQSTLNDIVERISSRFKPERIILFGSHAQGTSGADSDLDLMIVMDVDGSTRQKANEIDLLLVDRTVPLDIIVVTPAQYEKQRGIVGTIVRQADREGKIMYERAA